MCYVGSGEIVWFCVCRLLFSFEDSIVMWLEYGWVVIWVIRR